MKKQKQNNTHKPKVDEFESLLNDVASTCPHICDFCYYFSGNHSKPGIRPAHCEKLWNNPFFEVLETDTCKDWSWERNPMDFDLKDYFNKPGYSSSRKSMSTLKIEIPELICICAGVSFKICDTEYGYIEFTVCPGYDCLTYQTRYDFKIQNQEQLEDGFLTGSIFFDG